MLFKDGYDGCDKTDVAYLIKRSDGTTYTVGYLNALGGVCDCCCEVSEIDNCVVLRIVDMYTGETLYKDEAQ